METLKLGSTGRETTRLGFGCGSVMGVLGWRDSLAVLESAYDAGIRHYDVAPAYGYGEAERCLGEFLARHPGHLTVTTKFGIPKAGRYTVKGVARRLARPVLRVAPGLKRRLPGVSAAVAHTDTFVSGPNPIFTAERARRSVENSLRALRLDHIDLLLLHEARAMDLAEERLLRTLEDLVASGKIGDFGIGSEGSKIAALRQQKSAFCRVLQYEWSVMDETVPQDDAFRLHHRALTQNFRSLHAALVANPARCRSWSGECGLDLGNADVLAGVMLKVALLCNPHSVILFSSKQRQNVAKNAAVARDGANAAQALRFRALVRAELHRDALAAATRDRFSPASEEGDASAGRDLAGELSVRADRKHS